MTTTPAPAQETYISSHNDRGKDFLETGKLSDCEFVVGSSEEDQKSFHCHKLLLSVASPVFEAMFYGGLAKENEVIPILDIKVEAFETMLEYIYSVRTKIKSIDHGIHVAFAANKYMLENLEKSCIEYLKSSVTSSTVLHVLEAALLINAVTLQATCMKIIGDSTMTILSSESFCKISVSTLEKILDSENMNYNSEVDLFKAVERWALSNSKKHSSIRRLLAPVLKKIRFLSMSTTEFAEGPAQSSLLTKDEMLAILVNIATASQCNTNFPMPKKFCNLKTQRKPIISQFHNNSWNSKTARHNSHPYHQTSLFG